MHTGRKNPSWHRFEPCKLKKIRNIFFCLFFFISCIFIYMVGACVLNIIINIFFSQITMVNYQVTVLLDRLLSNGLAILGANYYYVHTVCVQVTITQIKLYICKGESFFTVYLFNEWQLFTSWFISFSFLVYKMWCTVIMHIQN